MFSALKNIKIGNIIIDKPRLRLIVLNLVLGAIPVKVIAAISYKNFTSKVAVGKPSNLSPAYSTTSLTPSFRWDCTCYTTKYRVYLKEGDGNFFAGSWYKDVLGGSGTNSTSFGSWINNNYRAAPSSLNVGTTYYWAVSCVTGGCNTSDTQSFTVLNSYTYPTPTTVTKPTSLNVTGDPMNPTFTWAYSGTTPDKFAVWIIQQGYLTFLINVSPTVRSVDFGDGLNWSLNTSQGAIPMSGPTHLEFGSTFSFQVLACKSTCTASDQRSWNTPPRDSDADGDSFTAFQEYKLLTNSISKCGPNAWPPDFNNDGIVTTADLGILASHFTSTLIGKIYDPNARYDININGYVNNNDAVFVSAYLNKSCK
jgi:hypothetical protein